MNMDIELKKYALIAQHAREVKKQNLAIAMWSVSVALVTIVWLTAALLGSGRLGLAGLVLIIPAALGLTLHLNFADKAEELEKKL